MKKTCILLAVLLIAGWGARAQKKKENPTPEIKQKLNTVRQNPNTAKRAAQADVLLVPSRRWTSGHPNIPARYDLGPNSEVKPKQ